MNLSLLTVFIFICMAISYKPVSDNSQSFLNKDNCINLRGVMAICIILCHVLLEIPSEDLGLSKVFFHCGYLCVSVFFFLSGYGLYVSQQKCGDYYKTIK